MRIAHRLAVQVALVLLPVAAVQGADSFAPIAVSVHSQARGSREAAPVTFGVPFGRGQLRDAGKVDIRTAKGAQLPVQTRVLARWPDGSVRWLLADTAVDVNRRTPTSITVRAGSPRAVAKRVVVEDGKDAVSVDTGVLAFSVPKTRFGIVENVRFRDRGVAPQPLTAVLAHEDKEGAARAPEKVEILESGPLRARIALRGTFGNGFDYLIRLEAYAGQSWIRVQHTFFNNNDAAYVDLTRLRVEWPFVGGPGGEFAYGAGDKKPRSGSIGDRGLRIAQLDNGEFQVAGAKEEGKLDGWLAWRGKGIQLGIASRWFWQEYPQALEVANGRLTYDMWASEGGTAKVGTGAAKTHELIVWVASANADPTRYAAAVSPPIAAVDATWIAASDALPQAVRPPADGFVAKVVKAAERYMRRNQIERWDDHGSVICARGEERPRIGAFGMWNWGDWNFPGYHDDIKGCDAWGNLEYDTTQVLALAFAASGRPDLEEATVVAARHFLDVDTIHHYGPRPEWVGMNHPKNPLHFSFDLGGVDLGHTWNEGLLSYYYLTGDERGLEAARGIADYLVGRVKDFVLRGNPRQWGWPQIALVAFYEATGEVAYRDAALDYAHRGMKAHPATGIQKWKLGILADGLAYTHAVTGDAEIESWLRQYSAAVAARKTPLDSRMYPAIAYVASLGPEPDLRKLAEQRAAGLDLGSWGKPFSINGRLGFRLYSLLARPIPGAHAPASKPTRKRSGKHHRPARLTISRLR